MFEKLAMSMAISFVLKQLDRFKGAVDWDKVQKDLDDRVRAMIPGTWFDDDAVAFVNSILAGVRHVLGDSGNVQMILKDLAAQDWSGAANQLRALVSSAWSSGAVASNSSARELMSSVA